LDGVRVLVVDDEEGLREIIHDELTYHGATVTGAASGNRAFALMAHERFDAVISDVIMDDGDGPSLIKRINAGVDPRPQLFLCTGFSDLSPAQVAGLNVAGIFEKPFERDALVRAVARALGRMAAE
jgi:DNA-binding NtrC family response regulator